MRRTVVGSAGSSGAGGQAGRSAGAVGRRSASSLVRAWISAWALVASVFASLTPRPSASPSFGRVFGSAPQHDEDEDDDQDDAARSGMRGWYSAAASAVATWRARAERDGMTRRSAVCVAENDATLLSTRPAAFAASMTSTSRRVAALPLRDTTQIAPFGRIRLASVVERREGVGRVGAEQDDVGVGLRPALGQVGRPLGDERADRPASSMSIRATRIPGRIPSLSSSGVV